MPDEAVQLGEQYALGTPLSTYKAHYSRAGMRFFYSQVAFMVLALIFLTTTLVATFVYHQHNITWILFVMIMLNSLNILNITRRKDKTLPVVSPFERNVRVYVYSGGLIYIRKVQPVVVRWGQVQQVRYIRPSGPMGRQASVTIVYKSNDATKRVGVGNILTNEELDALGTQVERLWMVARSGMQNLTNS
jgi:hypothetical protein